MRRPMKNRTISVPKDFTLGGKYLLPIVNDLFQAGDLQQIPPLQGNRRKPEEVCGSFDEELERVSFTQVLESSQSLIRDSSSENPQRAKLPLDLYKPLDRTDGMGDVEDLKNKSR